MLIQKGLEASTTLHVPWHYRRMLLSRQIYQKGVTERMPCKHKKGERKMTKAEKNCKVFSVITAVLTVFAVFIAVWYGVGAGELFGMTPLDEPLDIGVGSLTFGVLGMALTAICLLAQTIIGFKSLKSGKGGGLANIFMVIEMFLMLLVDNVLFGDAWQKWIIYLVIMIPSALQTSFVQKVCKQGTQTMKL